MKRSPSDRLSFTKVSELEKVNRLPINKEKYKIKITYMNKNKLYKQKTKVTYYHIMHNLNIYFPQTDLSASKIAV